MTAPVDVDPAEDRYVLDERPRAKRLRYPLIVGGLLVACTTYIALVDPNRPGHYPLCPTKMFFGIDCPGCGGLRATHALAHGDVLLAFDHNALFVALVPFLVVGYLLWLYRAWTGRSPRMTPARARWDQTWPIALMLGSLLFMIVRNVTPFLGSGVG